MIGHNGGATSAGYAKDTTHRADSQTMRRAMGLRVILVVVATVGLLAAVWTGQRLRSDAAHYGDADHLTLELEATAHEVDIVVWRLVARAATEGATRTDFLDSIEEIAYLNDICDRLGMDTISAGNLAAFAIEAARQGKIDYDIDYNEPDKIANLLKDMAYRRGIGKILSQGIKAAAKEWGMEDQAIHVKGLEPAGYDPRVLKGMGLAYGSSPRGACHLRATFYKPELTKMIDPDQIEGKAEMFARSEEHTSELQSH